jgi:Carbohydrate esterase, sialic acid-specific acetylesterase
MRACTVNSLVDFKHLLVGVVCFAMFQNLSKADEFDVIYLGGQSNMEGFGFVRELPEELKQDIPGCFIFHAHASLDRQPIGGNGKWSPLKPGHGVGFTSDGKGNKYSDRFGVELSIAAELRRERPDRKIAIVKYARNGSSIHQDAAGSWGCWEPDFRAAEGDNRDINQYDHFLATIRTAHSNADVDQDGTMDTLNPIGIVWMQGESDAVHSPEIAQQYQQNLKRLMDLMRASLRVDDLPVVIGRISDSGVKENRKVWAHGDIVRAGQAAFVDSDPAARLISTTDDYGYSDPWHYDSAGYIDLGRQFAKGLIELR